MTGNADKRPGFIGEQGVRNWKQPTPFGLEAIQRNASGVATSLAVQLSGETLPLARLDVDSHEKPGEKDTIFYLNISPDKNTEFYTPGAYEAAVRWYEEQLMAQGVRVFVIPPSHKSTDALHEAVRRANTKLDYEIKIIDLVGGKKESDVKDAHDRLRKRYVPVTTPGGKYIGMTPEDAKYLYDLAEESMKDGKPLVIWIGDDVVSSGETIEAMKDLLHRATDGRVDIYVLTVALEAPMDEFPPEADSHTVAAIGIIEVKGGLKDSVVAAVA